MIAWVGRAREWGLGTKPDSPPKRWGAVLTCANRSGITRPMTSSLRTRRVGHGGASRSRERLTNRGERTIPTGSRRRWATIVSARTRSTSLIATCLPSTSLLSIFGTTSRSSTWYPQPCTCVQSRDRRLSTRSGGTLGAYIINKGLPRCLNLRLEKKFLLSFRNWIMMLG